MMIILNIQNKNTLIQLLHMSNLLKVPVLRLFQSLMKQKKRNQTNILMLSMAYYLQEEHQNQKMTMVPQNILKLLLIYQKRHQQLMIMGIISLLWVLVQAIKHYITSYLDIKQMYLNHQMDQIEQIKKQKYGNLMLNSTLIWMINYNKPHNNKTQFISLVMVEYCLDSIKLTFNFNNSLIQQLLVMINQVINLLLQLNQNIILFTQPNITPKNLNLNGMYQLTTIKSQYYLVDNMQTNLQINVERTLMNQLNQLRNKFQFIIMILLFQKVHHSIRFISLKMENFICDYFIYKKMKTFIIITIVLVYVIQARHHTWIKEFEAVTDKPVIGILTQPSEYSSHPKSEYSYLAASYVKFVESAGARVIPIPFEATQTQLDKYYEMINGVIFPGGGNDLDTSSGPTQLTKTIAYFIKKGLLAKNNGEIFPIFAICLGHEAVHYIISGYQTPYLFRVYDEEAVSHSLENVDRTSMLYKDLDDQLYKSLTVEEVIYYNHNWAVSPDFYKLYPVVDQFFDIVATNKDSKGQIYVAAAQAKDYPIFSVQYHPEKNIYEWKIPANHSDEAVLISQNQINMFMELARMNIHQQDEQELKKLLIYNYKTVQEDASSFVQVYYFKIGEVIV